MEGFGIASKIKVSETSQGKLQCLHMAALPYHLMEFIDQFICGLIL